MGLLCMESGLQAQKARQVSLDEILQEARENSIRSKVASTRNTVAINQYEIFRSGLRPQIRLYGNIPGYSKEFSQVTQPDGTISFEPVQQSLASFGLGLTQNIAQTGGSISLNSDLSRFRDMRNKNTRFNGTPIYISLVQPLFAVNPIKWQKQIEPLKLKEAELLYKQELSALDEQVTYQFFDLLEAQALAEIARQNLVYSNDNLETEKKRILLGTTGEDKLLQLELQVLNNRQQLQQANYQKETSVLALRNLLGRSDTLGYVVLAPATIPQLPISASEAVALARANRPEYIGFERQRLEAEWEIANAKSASQQVNLVASYGLNRADPRIAMIYSDPQSHQRFNVGFEIPVVDWGRRKAALHTAEALQQLTEYSNAVEKINIEQEIIALYNNLQLLRNNIALAMTTDSVAARRYELSNQLYMRGQLSITELGIAQSEKDNARRTFIAALRSYWQARFKFNSITGYSE